MSAVMSSQSAVDKKRKSWISDDDVITISIASYSDPDATMNSAVAQRQKKSSVAIKIWMSTAELISNVEDDKNPAKERTQGQLPVGALQNIFQTESINVQRIEFEQRLFKGEELKEERDDCAMIS
ncbi:hypothetical protein F511_44849 [Dorcoceras hygrometricum]|uniref:Uncharacterized protein n=1 Tax=Dorcoceras hygrometricum TaxID=472368 RepID=A0A2Z7BMZ5_9LAMI|nr:hypothetical protein F511_44849 [Dorcoceras hygrometricum]